MPFGSLIPDDDLVQADLARQMAAARTRWSARPPTGRPETGATDTMRDVAFGALVPQSMTDLGLMMAAGPFGKAAKFGGAALMALDPTAAEAGPVSAVKNAVKGIRAYHGTPHDFDKFDLGRMGSGEGAQTYGHGLYFAENPAVAREYREKLSDKTGFTTYSAAGGVFERGSPEWKMLATVKDRGMPSARSLLKSYEDDLARGEPYITEMGGTDFVDRARAALTSVTGKSDITPRYGREYEVQINTDPAHLIDWDRPLRDQVGPTVDRMMPHLLEREGVARNAIDRLLARPNTFTRPEVRLREEERRAQMAARAGLPLEEAVLNQSGETAYKQFGLPAISQEKGFGRSTAALRDLGVPGLQYLDQGSRLVGGAPRSQMETRLKIMRDDLARIERDGGGNPDRLREQISSLTNQLKGAANPTRNYVVFDDSLVDILRKYALPGMVGGGAAFGSLSPDDL